MDDMAAGSRAVWRPGSERERRLTEGADPSTQTGLEFGALHNPVVPPGAYDMRYVDYADTPTLRARHADHPEWCERMVEVDYVWSGTGSLAAVVGGREIFDFAIASHVVEHVPNMLGWFRGVAEVMKIGGVFNLAIPDKRFTFDIACPDSTVGELIEADLLGYTRPSIRQMFDHCYYGKAIEPGEIWTRRIDLSAVPPYSGEVAPELAWSQARKILAEGSYIDSHCWIVTPSSFVDLLQGACRLNLFPFLPVSLTPTPLGLFEFYLTLRKPEPMSAEALRSRQLASLAAIKQSCADQRRWSMLLAGDGAGLGSP